MRVLLPIVAAVAVSFASGCATIIKGSYDVVYFESDPPAEVWVDSALVGTATLTPELRIPLESKDVHYVEFRLGKERLNFTLTRSLSAGYLVADILLGFIPLIVDAATGDWNSIDQERLRVEFHGDGQPSLRVLPAPPKAKGPKRSDEKGVRTEKPETQCPPYKPDCKKRRKSK